VTGTVAQKMYAAQAAAAQSGAGDTSSDKAGPAGDDVVDAEFEEVSDSDRKRG
jgi:molecular chaperone DnaK